MIYSSEFREKFIKQLEKINEYSPCL